MTICLRCHRPLKNPTPSGYGPVCAKTIQPPPEVGRDLFGYDINAAAISATSRLADLIEGRAAVERHAIREAFRDAGQRLGVRS